MMQNPIPNTAVPIMPPHTGVIIPEIIGMRKKPDNTKIGPKRFNFLDIKRDIINKIQPIENVTNAIIAPRRPNACGCQQINSGQILFWL